MNHRRAIMLAACGLAGLLVGAAPDDFQKNLERLTHINDAKELERLKGNFEAFRILPAESRDQLRRLHADLSKPGADKKQLDEVLTRFAQWLDTLPPSKRKQLEDERNLEARLELVATLIKEQNQQLADLRKTTEPEKSQIPSERDPLRLRRRGRFSTEYLSLEPQLLSKLLEPQRQKLAATPKEDRVAWIIVYGRFYGVEHESFAPEKTDFFLGMLHMQMRTLQLPVPSSARWYGELDDESKVQFLEVATKALTVPTADRATLLDYFAALKLSGPGASGFWMSHKMNSSLFWQLLSFRYYLDNPGKSPKELQVELEPYRQAMHRARPDAPDSKPAKTPGDRQSPQSKRIQQKPG